MMAMTEEPDFNHALSCLDDFDVDESFEALLKGHDLFVKQEGGAHNGHLQAKPSINGGVHGVKRHSHRPGVAGGKRSFKDYTKPIKRGFLNRQIPANDIRRFLAQIVVHACNLHNPDHLATVLKEYCGPSVVLNTRFIGNADTHPIKNAIMYRELHGIGHITRYFDALLQAVPDGVIKLLDSKVHMFQNGCSYIVGKFVFKGQKCFDLVTVGDTKDKRAVPSKFDRRSVAAAAAAAAQARQLGQNGNNNCGSLFDPSPLNHYAGSAMDPFHFLSESAVMLDLEAFLLDDMDGDDQIVFGQPPVNALQGGPLPNRVESQASLCSQSSDKTQTMSVALENKPIDFYVPHSRKEVQEVPLSLLGTMAFYLDPDAKIFKIEVLHALEGNEKERHHKKARRS